MKRVNGSFSVKALGRYDFEFFTEDNISEKEIEKIVNEMCTYYITYDIEDYDYEKEI